LGVRAPPPPPPGAPPAVFRRAPALRRCFWDKVTHTRGTWWEDLRGDDTAVSGETPAGETPALGPAREAALRKAFAAASPASRRGGGNGDGRRRGAAAASRRSARGAPRVVSVQRANNVSIALARIRIADTRGELNAPTHEALARAVASGNFRGALDADTLAALLAAAPTEEETRAFADACPPPRRFRVEPAKEPANEPANEPAKEPQEDTATEETETLARLSDPERFLCLMARVPRVREKLAAASFAAEFEETAAGVAAALDAVSVACDEVRRSKQLKALLAAALAAGNVLNEGTPRGDAAGFTLDSLHKLADVKSARLSALTGGATSDAADAADAADAETRDAGTVADGSAADHGVDGTLLDFVVAAADARLRGDGEYEDDEDPSGVASVASRFSLAAELGACEAASRWSRADLASALARVELGARHAAFEAERARAAAAELAERESLESLESRGAHESRSGTHESSALVDLRRCAAALAEFVGDSEPRRRALSALAAFVDEKFFALCAYVGEGHGYEKEGNSLNARDVSELFGGLWAFAASVDAARERRIARAAGARGAEKDRRDRRD